MAAKEKNVVAIEPIKIQQATVYIEGDGDLVLNKMNARTIRELTDAHLCMRMTERERIMTGTMR